MPRLAYVELAENGMPIRIFRSRKAWAKSDVPMLVQRDRAEAVGLIRWQVYERDGGCCVKCGKWLPWDGSPFERANMHEVVSKGKGGEVSIANCVIHCFACHQGEHPEKQVRWTKRTIEKESACQS